MTEQLKLDVVLRNFASKELTKIDQGIKKFTDVNTKQIGKLGAAFTGVNAALGTAGSGLLKLGGQAGTAINALGEVSTAFALGGPLVAGVAAGIGLIAAGFVSYQASIEGATAATGSYQKKLEDLKAAADATKDLTGGQQKGLERLQATLNVLNAQKGKLGLSGLEEQELAFKELSTTIETYRQSLIDLEIINKRFPEGSIETLRTYFDTKEALEFLIPLQKQYGDVLKKNREETKQGTDEALRFTRELERQNEQLMRFREQKDFGFGIQAAFRDMAIEAQNFGAIGYRAVRGIEDALASGLSNEILAIVDGTKSAKEAFRDFAKQVLKDLAAIIVKETILLLVRKVLGTPSLVSVNVGASAGRRTGGVVHGHLEPVLAHAQAGTVARRRGLYELREGPHDEAVVPMLDNRSIPVKWVGDKGAGRGGGAPQVTINLTYNSNALTTSQEKALIAGNAKEIAAAVASEMRQNAAFRDSLRAA